MLTILALIHFFFHLTELLLLCSIILIYSAAVVNNALLHCVNCFIYLKICRGPLFSRWTSNDLKSLIFKKNPVHIIFKIIRLVCYYNKFS